MSEFQSVGYAGRALAVRLLRPAPGYRLPPAPAPIGHAAPDRAPYYRLEVLLPFRGWRMQGSARCRLDLAVFARACFPGRRFRLVEVA